MPAIGPAAAQAVAEFHRLFLAPGLEHCQLGLGANVLDLQVALENWVEKGIAPDRITATKFVNDAPPQGVAFTRPLCPYPQKAHYKGNGAQTDASSFVCSAAGERAAYPDVARTYHR